MLWKEKKSWIRRIWDCYKKAKRHDNAVRTRFLKCILASILIILGREGQYSYDQNYYEIAWIDTGTYYTDYGFGRSWDTLGICGLKYAIWSDGSL